MLAMFDRFTFGVSLEDALDCSGPGPADENIAALAASKRMAPRLAKLDPQKVRAELESYGAWDEAELQDDAQNLQRILWIACCNIAEESGRSH